MNWFKPHEYDDSNNILQSRSVFTPYKEPEPQPCMSTMFEEKKRKNEIQYLPGEKLLMRLEKIRTKEGGKKNIIKVENDFNVDRLSDSLARVLKTF
jgi:hypothetical protein